MPTDTNPRYDEVPYESHPYEQTHPRWLATIATLFGMTPTPPTHARILELGCASGGNLIPMAEALPNSSCLGIDLSSRQIQDGQVAILATGLQNVELRRASILDVDESFGEFDYIICHGVYSWVDRSVQRCLLELCGTRLAHNGIACISYNTLPGWHMLGMLRDMMRYHADRFNQPTQQVAQSRALLDVLAKTVTSADNPYGMLLKQESAKLERCSDWYIYHEQLEEHNDPVYFYQFIERAEAEGLQFLGESELPAMLTDRFSPEIQAALREVSSNLVYAEQYMDFFCNRTFRNTLLCRKAVALQRKLGPQQIMPFSFATALVPHSEVSDPSMPEPVEFERLGWHSITVNDPIGKAALLILGGAWPEHFTLLELETRVRARLRMPQLRGQASLVFADKLWTWFTHGIVNMTVSPPVCVAKAGERPEGSLVARAQIAAGANTVTNLLHSRVKLDPFETVVLTLLDGTLDKAVICQRLYEDCQFAPSFSQAPPGRGLVLRERVEAALVALADAALLRA